MKKVVSVKKVEEFPIYDITVDDVHCFELDNGVISHNSLYPKAIVSGGQGGILSSNDIWIISRRQEKEGKELAGYSFVINIEKSRRVKEGSKFPITVTYEGGLNKWSGLFDLALEAKFLVSSKKGWYQTVDLETGEVNEEKSYRRSELEYNAEYWKSVISADVFKKYITSHFAVATGKLLSDDEVIVENVETEEE